MKHILKISIVILAVIIIASSFCGCSLKKEKLFETEYFKYEIYTISDTEYVRIKGLTELGKQQEYIVIPEEIDGRIVESYRGLDEVPNLKAHYISYNLKVINSWLNQHAGTMFYGAKHAGETFYISSTYTKTANYGGGGFISSVAEESYRKTAVNFDNAYKFANVQYMFNYEDSPNMGVHFIDNTEVGAKVNVIPIIPKRDGYKFTGWYSEPECINEIILETYQKADKEILYLYAGWQEK